MSLPTRISAYLDALAEWLHGLYHGMV